MTAARPPAIETRALRKTFGEKTVLDGIDLTVAAGTVFALLGPNGAGKTTTVNILSTLITADSGSARVAGHDVVREAFAVRSAIGVTGQFSAVDGLLTGAENLRLMADLHHLGRTERYDRTTELLQRFDLSDVADKPAMTYSGGMKRKLDLAMTLVGSPRVIFLDEPTSGLDPRSRRGLWDLVRGLVADGVTILLTTQYLDEADQLADRIAVLNGGRIVAEGTPAELKRRAPGGTITLHVAGAEELESAARAFPDSTTDPEALTVSLSAGSDIPSIRAVLDQIERSAVTASHLDVTSPNLDDVFLALTEPESQVAS